MFNAHKRIAMIAIGLAVSAVSANAKAQRSVADDWDAEITKSGREASVIYGDNGGLVTLHEEREPFGPPTGKLVINHIAYSGVSPQTNTTITELYRGTILSGSITRQRIAKIAAVLTEGYANRPDALLHVAVIAEEFSLTNVATAHTVHLLTFNFSNLNSSGTLAQPLVRKLSGFPSGVWPRKLSLAIGTVPTHFVNGEATDYDLTVVAGNGGTRDANVSTIIFPATADEEEIIETPVWFAGPPDRIGIYSSRRLGMTLIAGYTDSLSKVALFFSYAGFACTPYYTPGVRSSCGASFTPYRMPSPHLLPFPFTNGEINLENAAADLDEQTLSLFFVGHEPTNPANWITLKLDLGNGTIRPTVQTAPPNFAASCDFPPGLQVVEGRLFTACVARKSSVQVFQTTWAFATPSVFTQQRAELRTNAQNWSADPPLLNVRATPSIAIDRTQSSTSGPTIVWGRTDFGDPTFDRGGIFLEPGR